MRAVRSAKRWFVTCWAALLLLIPLLLRRLETDTLLPGTLREEELDYEAQVQATKQTAKNVPVPRPTVLRAWASALGYDTLLVAMFRSLNYLMLPWCPAAQKTTVESFVLQGLDVIPRTAGVPNNLISGEEHVVSIIEKDMNPHDYRPAFCAAVLRKWRSEAVSSVLRARGVLQTGVATAEQSTATFKARQHADIA